MKYDPDFENILYKVVFENAARPALVSNRDGKIVATNQEFDDLFGWDRAKLRGEPVEALIPDRFVGHHLRYRAEYMQHPKRRFMGALRKLECKRADGSIFLAEIELNPVSIPGYGRFIAVTFIVE